MLQQDPWAEFNPTAVDSPGGIVPLPAKPDLPPAQTPAQAEKDVLEVDKLKKELQDPAANPANAEQTDVLLKQIAHVRELAQKPMSLGAGTGYLSYIPIIGQNAADMRASLQQIQGDLIQKGIARLRELNGGKGAATMANTEKEGERIAASFAALSPDQSPEEFIKGLNDAEAFYKGVLAKSAGDKPAAATSDAPPEASHDNGITKSAQLPAIQMSDPTAVSTENKVVISPFLEKFGPKIEQMLAADPKQISNAMIIGFIQKNGGDASTLQGLQENLKFRTSKERQGLRWSPNVDPRMNVPLEGAEKVRAEVSGSPEGAFAAGLADTGTFGASPDIVAAATALTGGDYGDARRDFQGKQQMLAYENPKATVAGNVLGGLSTLGMTAPESFAGLVGQAGGQGAIYGGLSSEDPSIGGRVTNALSSGLTNAVAAAVMDPALRGVAMGGRKVGNVAKRVAGATGDDIADSNALTSFAAHAPNQDVPAMRARATEQTGLGAEPSGVTTLDRSGQDYLGRQVARSPGAREAADKAVDAAREKLPKQLEADFATAIDDAAGGQEHVATFLKRPAREITKDVQEMAGREFEAGISPIKHETVPITPELTEVLTHEQTKSAISDALLNHSLDDTTRNLLRGLPRTLKEVGGMDPKLADKVLKGLPIDVDTARNIATALDRKAAKLAEDSEGRFELRRLSKTIRTELADLYPEFRATNDRYASRMKAIEALDGTRETFLGDESGRATDRLAKATDRMSDTPGEPEFGRGPDAVDKTKFNITRPPQSMPSQKQMAIAGAKEAALAKAGRTKTSGASTAEGLSAPGQSERNRMVLGDSAGKIEDRAAAKAENVRATERLQSGGTADDAGGKVAAGVKAVANAGFHRGGAMIASALSGIRGLSPADAARVVKLYTDPNKAEFVISSLESAYGRRKARFIIDRIAALSVTANKRRPLPDEATDNDQ